MIVSQMMIIIIFTSAYTCYVAGINNETMNGFFSYSLMIRYFSCIWFCCNTFEQLIYFLALFQT